MLSEFATRKCINRVNQQICHFNISFLDKYCGAANAPMKYLLTHPELRVSTRKIIQNIALMTLGSLWVFPNPWNKPLTQDSGRTLHRSSDSKGYTSCRIPSTPHVRTAIPPPFSSYLTAVPKGRILPLHLDINRVPLRRHHNFSTSHQASVCQAAFQTPTQRDA